MKFIQSYRDRDRDRAVVATSAYLLIIYINNNLSIFIALNMNATTDWRHFPVRLTRGVQKVLQLDYEEEWKCHKLHFTF